MNGYTASAGTGQSNKCAAVPPIMIHSSTPCPPPVAITSSSACILPPISPQASLTSGPLLKNGLQVSDANLQVKQENVNFVQPSSCMFNYQSHIGSRNPPSNIHLLNQPRLPNRISPLASTSTGVQHLQLSHNYMAPSPLLSDLSPTRSISKPYQSKVHPEPSHTEKRGKIKTEFSAGTHKLPPLSGYTPGSNLDIEDTLSPLLPPIHSLSPYLGSGISEIPSFPSILASPAHLSRKRTLSTSPLSDMIDIYAFRSSPNSLMANLYNNASNPMTPSGSVPLGNNNTVGHLIGQSNTAVQAMQYRVQQRRTSIEHNQNDDGTTNTTITNQVTFSENPQTMKYGAVPGNFKLQKSMGTEPMEMDTGSLVSTNLHERDYKDPHICLWEGCELKLDDLDDLVQHIENAHIEKGKADEYVCLWQSCIRGLKPFNARYKLLIHMRIHSGEKPNKCTVS